MEAYRKCTVCKHITEITDEKVEKCSNCKLTLDNTYSEWHEKNPSKTFNDYKQEVCFTSDEKAKIQKRKKIIKTIGFGLLIVVFALIKIYNRGTLDEFIDDVKISNMTWSTQLYNDMQVDLPYQLDTMKYDLTALQKITVEDMEFYQSSSDVDIVTVLYTVKYRFTSADSNLYSIALSSLNAIENREGVSEMKYEIDSSITGDFKQYICSGSYSELSNPFSFTMNFYAQDKCLWQLSNIYMDKDTAFANISDRIINSIRIIK